ncbi:MAG: DEAD/DEAH box helicase [Bacteroidota bacterium]|nr:DEAD/DEAH box helicase [Bacteroidota bacterium]
MTFFEFELNERLLKAVDELGYEVAMPVQQEVIPLVLQNERDIIALAQTGTGKTAAFGLPLLELINYDKTKPQVIILSPTRELCMQIAKDIQSYAKYTDKARIISVYGGVSIDNQIREIKKGVQIIVATPGRFIDLIERGHINFSDVQWVVLDEADEMLSMGFEEDMKNILSRTPAEKRVFLFSATMPTEIGMIGRQYMENPIEITIGVKNSGAENVEHLYYLVHAKDKYPALKRIADYNPDIYSIVFCRTKSETQEVSEHLIKDGYNADALHGDLSQNQRDNVMNRFRNRNIQMLIATDVAARGLDIDDVTHVINYGLPAEIETYTHRSGRTARAGKSGVSIAITNLKEKSKIRQIEKRIKKQFTYAKVPTGFEVCEKQLYYMISKVQNITVDEKGISKYISGIYEGLEYLSKEEIIKRFVSLEFNRFLEYYRKSPDLNVDPEKEINNGSDRTDNGNKRLFINLGISDNFNKGSLADYVAKTVKIDRQIVANVFLMDTYSFFDVIDDTAAEDIINTFRKISFNNRRVKVEYSQERKQEKRYEKKQVKRSGFKFSESNDKKEARKNEFSIDKKKGYKKREAFSGEAPKPNRSRRKY